MAATNDSRPGKDFSVITQNGLTAHALATKHQTALSPRLPDGLLDSLAADLKSLGAQIPGTTQVRAESAVATASQDEELAKGYALASAVRTAVTRSNAADDVKKAYGVGLKTSPKVVRDVKGLLNQIIKRAKKYPDEAKAFGILPKDLLEMSAAVTAIDAADTAQEKQRADAPLSTKERNATGRRILAAVDKIIGAGVIEFARSPTERAAFEALIGKGNAEKKKKGGEEKEGEG